MPGDDQERNHDGECGEAANYDRGEVFPQAQRLDTLQHRHCRINAQVEHFGRRERRQAGRFIASLHQAVHDGRNPVVGVLQQEVEEPDADELLHDRSRERLHFLAFQHPQDRGPGEFNRRELPEQRFGYDQELREPLGRFGLVAIADVVQHIGKRRIRSKEGKCDDEQPERRASMGAERCHLKVLP